MLVLLLINLNPEIVPFRDNYLVHNLTSWQIDQSRISAWKVSSQAVLAKPLLGFGPGNYSIGFDAHYDPSLPGIQHTPTGVVTTWWDRAHNFLFDISLQAGIFALLVYLMFFGTLLWKLQKEKIESQLQIQGMLPGLH